MNPTLGIFLARDPWSGNAMRPGSMNGWNYVEGNPANLVDPTGSMPSGMGPERFNDEYRYSCNCGWIDWEHAGDPTLTGGAGVYDAVKNLYNIVKSPIDGNYYYKMFYYSVRQDVPVIGLSGVEILAYVKNQLPENSAKSVTTGIWMTLQLGFELFQGGEVAPNGKIDFTHLFIRGASRIVPSAQSAFAVEDLTSDTISVYRVLKDWSHEDIERICKVLSPKDSYDIYQQNQDMTGNYKNFSFWSPRYARVPCDKCDAESAWPNELLDIEPNWQQRGIWEIMGSDVKYSGGFHDPETTGMPPVLATLLGLPQ